MRVYGGLFDFSVSLNQTNWFRVFVFDFSWKMIKEFWGEFQSTIPLYKLWFINQILGGFIHNLTHTFQGSLVSIHDNETNSFIQSLTPDRIWIGAKRIGNISKLKGYWANFYFSWQESVCQCIKIPAKLWLTFMTSLSIFLDHIHVLQKVLQSKLCPFWHSWRKLSI